MILGGRTASGQWKTAEAKQYPSELCRLVAQAFADHAKKVDLEGFEDDPIELDDALSKLSFSWDPYVQEEQTMLGDFQPQRYGS